MQNIKERRIEYPFLTEPLFLFERENGHKIVLAHKEGELANVSTWVKTGSINENDEITGISHFLEHVMFKGTNKHAAGEFDKYLEAHGAIVNAATWKDYTFYYVTLPKGENNCNLYKTIELHADMMLDPIFPEHELGKPFNLDDESHSEKRERNVVIEEINMRKDQHWSKVYNLLNSNMYTAHPYRRDVIGTPEVISSVTRETINNYYQKYYSPNNMVTIIVGDYNKDDVLKYTVEAFDFKGRKQTEQQHFALDTPPTNTKIVETTANVNTAFLMMGYLGPTACDLRGTIIMDILNIVLGEGQSSRLYKHLIERAGEPIFNLIVTDYYSFKDGGNFLVQANFRPEFKNEAIELVKQEITNLIQNGLEQHEFDKAKKKIKSRFAESAETVSEIADNIGQYVTVCEDLSLANEYLKVLESITCKNTVDFACEYLDINKATIAVLLPKNAPVNGSED